MAVSNPKDESSRLMILNQSKIMETETNSDPDYDRITSLVQRLFSPSFVVLSFVDDKEQFIQSFSHNVSDDNNTSDCHLEEKPQEETSDFIKDKKSIKKKRQSIPLEESIDAKLFETTLTNALNAHELIHVLDCTSHSHLLCDSSRTASSLKEALRCSPSRSIVQYVSSEIRVNHYSVGMLSLVYCTSTDSKSARVSGSSSDTETESPLPTSRKETKSYRLFTDDDKVNLQDFADIVGGLVRQQWENEMKLQRERANVMLGLNQHLRTPLTTMTIVTEMLRNEIDCLSSIAKTVIPPCKSNDDEFFEAVWPVTNASFALESPRAVFANKLRSAGSSGNMTNGGTVDITHASGNSTVPSVVPPPMAPAAQGLQINTNPSTTNTNSMQGTPQFIPDIDSPTFLLTRSSSSEPSNTNSNSNPNSYNNNNSVWKNFGVGLQLSTRALSNCNSRRNSGTNTMLSAHRDALVSHRLERGGSFYSDCSGLSSGPNSFMFNNNNNNSSLNNLHALNSLNNMGSTAASSVNNNVSTSCNSTQIGQMTQHTNITYSSNYLNCLGLMDDLQSSVQQLILFVEMGLVLGKIALVMNDSTSHYQPYEVTQVDIMSIYEKLQLLTQQIGHHSAVEWELERLRTIAMEDDRFYIHSDMLLAVLISCLTQILPYADKIAIKTSLPSYEDMLQCRDRSQHCHSEDSDTHQNCTGCNSDKNIHHKCVGGRSSLHCRVFQGSFLSSDQANGEGENTSSSYYVDTYLSTELEIEGNPANLEDVVKQLNIVCEDEEEDPNISITVAPDRRLSRMNATDSNSPLPMVSPTRKTLSNSKDGEEKTKLGAEGSEDYFSDSVFSIGSLLKGICADSRYIRTTNGGRFTFSFPCKIANAKWKHEEWNVEEGVDDDVDEEMDVIEEGINEDEDESPSMKATAKVDDGSPQKWTNDLSVVIGESTSEDSSEKTSSNESSSRITNKPQRQGPTKSKSSNKKNKKSSPRSMHSRTHSLSDSTMQRRSPASPLTGSTMIFPTSSVDRERDELSGKTLFVAERSLFDPNSDEEDASIVGESEVVQALTELDISAALETTNKRSQSRPYLALMPRQALQQVASKKLRVLMVDDSIIVQKVMSQWLRKKNCEVVTAANGELALELLKSTVTKFDVILLDFLMPVMDGITCMQKYQEYRNQKLSQALTSTTPANKDVEKQSDTFAPITEDVSQQLQQWIIGLSATAMSHDQHLAFHNGMNLFCTKPVDMPALGNILEAKRLGISINELAELIEVTRRAGTTVSSGAGVNSTGLIGSQLTLSVHHEKVLLNIMQLAEITLANSNVNGSNNSKSLVGMRDKDSDSFSRNTMKSSTFTNPPSTYSKMFGGFQCFFHY